MNNNWYKNLREEVLKVRHDRSQKPLKTQRGAHSTPKKAVTVCGLICVSLTATVLSIAAETSGAPFIPLDGYGIVGSTLIRPYNPDSAPEATTLVFQEQYNPWDDWLAFADTIPEQPHITSLHELLESQYD
jgi:hypothetical protein